MLGIITTVKSKNSSPSEENLIPTAHIVTEDSYKIHVKWLTATSCDEKNNKELTSKFHPFWLRDHCRCLECYHQITKQRLVNTFTIPKDIRASSINATSDGLNIVWSNDNHSSFFKWNWLRIHSYDPPIINRENPFTNRIFWNSQMIQNLFPILQFENVMQTHEGLTQMLKNLDQYGITFVDDVPVNVKDTEALARRICFIRETHYGGFYDFTPNLEHGDTAYTTLALKVHTDTTYFTDPIRLQMFHLLEFNGKGGKSIFVDGFYVANLLKSQNPHAYKTLSTIRIPAHCAGDKNICIQPTPHSFPILNHNPITSALYQIRYNNDDRSTMSHLKPDQVEEFYDALRAWNKLLQDSANEFLIQLVPGRAVLFDNWRVLHGRTAFVGHRRLTGAYLNHDDYQSRLKVNCLSLNEIEESL
ncbi:2994_t:CDS:2 [Ambispora leptoticha]|uniref:trimethyllysine dioxygenase n=1 Tax=Ambispora leptoticha TaxID=144679 RepID=A0A9N9G352_9GLOM|nr:2994_t:CDS:2 [Ambispora leptoticha]